MKKTKIGPPIDYKAKTRAPVNEQGVVYLFGLCHDVLDFKIRSIQTGFPDCTAERKLSTGEWEEIHIEFEFESKSFAKHGHDPEGANMIVCWRDNWKACPEHIEVIELSTLLDLLPPDDNEKELSAYHKFCQKQRLKGYTFQQIAAQWKHRKTTGKLKEDKLTPWQLFSQEGRKAGLSFQEIAAKWKQQKKKS